MRSIHAAAVMSVLCAVVGFAAGATTKSTTPTKTPATTVKKSTAKSRTASKSPAPSTAKGATGTKKAPAKTVASASSPSTRRVKGKAVKSAPATTWRTRQQAPTPDRYKEIQQALVDKGYLKGEPTGVWDTDSASAMQRFQTDQKLTPTGKINAPSLIGLGLGAKSAGAPEAAPLKPDAPAIKQDVPPAKEDAAPASVPPPTAPAP